MKNTALIASLLASAPFAANAEQIAFNSGWKEQRFSMFSSNDFTLNGNTLRVKSDDTVSLMWTALPQAMWTNRQAQWDWAVEQSVPATNLTKKGGDDRNLALYFVFLPEAAAQNARSQGIKSLLQNPDARVLMYIWGGSHARGDVLPTPYLGARGRSMIRHAAGTGSASERVDLSKDFRRAFGEDATSLVGLAVSSDSDDTGGEVVARISQLRIE